LGAEQPQSPPHQQDDATQLYAQEAYYHADYQEDGRARQHDAHRDGSHQEYSQGSYSTESYQETYHEEYDEMHADRRQALGIDLKAERGDY